MPWISTSPLDFPFKKSFLFFWEHLLQCLYGVDDPAVKYEMFENVLYFTDNHELNQTSKWSIQFVKVMIERSCSWIHVEGKRRAYVYDETREKNY